MQFRKVPPDVFTYNILLSGLCLTQHIDEAFALLHTMKDKGINPDLATYAIVIDGDARMENSILV